MYAGMYVALKRTEVIKENRRKIPIFAVAKNCKVSSDTDAVCLKCGKCGRKFNELGKII